MEKVAYLFFIKTSTIFIGVGIGTIIVLGIIIYMKKRNAE